MKGMRQLLTKGQCFILFNIMILAFFYFGGTLHLNTQWLVSDAIAMAVVNVAALISANGYKDWKK